MTSSKKSLISQRVVCIVIYFLSSIFLQYALAAGNDSTLSYNLISRKDFVIHPNTTGDGIKVRSQAIVYVKPNPKMPNSYMAVFDTITISFLLDGGFTLNLNECPKLQKLIDDYKRPFMINKDEDGVLQSVTVSSDDSDVSVNFKLYAATRIQVNEGIVRQKKNQNQFTATVDEHLIWGNCKVNYDAKKYNNKFWITTKLNQESCDINNQDSEDIVADQEYLSDKCRSSTENNFEWSIQGRSSAGLMKDSVFIEGVTKTVTLSFEPWPNYSNILKFNGIDLARSVPTSKEITPPDFDDSNSVTVAEARYILVNRKYMEDDSNDGLRLTYRALACESSTLAYLLSLIEQALICTEL